MIRHQNQGDEAEKAHNFALHFLGFRARTTMEIKKHLEKKGFSSSVVLDVIERLKQADLLDDRMFARLYVEDRERFKPRSGFALSFELKKKGIRGEIIDEAVATVDDEASAWAAVLKKWPQWQNLDAETMKKKVMGHLKYRGFNYGVSMAAYLKCRAKHDPREEER